LGNADAADTVIFKPYNSKSYNSKPYNKKVLIEKYFIMMFWKAFEMYKNME